jgi:hypothetical protein
MFDRDTEVVIQSALHQLLQCTNSTGEHAMTVKDNINAINEMGNKGYERMNALAELNLRTWETLAARQMDAMNLLMEQGMRQMKLATESKGYNDFVKGEMELSKEMSSRMMEEAKANMKIAGQVRDDYRSWFQQGVSEVSAEMRKAAPAA